MPVAFRKGTFLICNWLQVRKSRGRRMWPSLPGQAHTSVTQRTLVQYKSSHAGVAQLFRARPCQGRGQGLESLYPHQMRLSERKVFFCWGGRCSTNWPILFWRDTLRTLVSHCFSSTKLGKVKQICSPY